MENEFEIREILQKDDAQLEAVVRGVFEELDVPKEGTAYADPALKQMYAAYQRPRASYFVVVCNDTVFGGAGIAPLDKYDGNVCELQKMYFARQARGKGLGAKLLRLCLQKAVDFRFDGCYLETMPYMDAAQRLYKKHGFAYIDSSMGCTGHSACPVYMFKKL